MSEERLFTLTCSKRKRLNLEPIDINKYNTKKIIDGSIFGSDPWSIHTLMLVAIGKTGDVNIIAEPPKMMTLANGLAVAGIPRVIELLKDGDADPIWNLSDGIDEMLRKNHAAKGQCSGAHL